MPGRFCLCLAAVALADDNVKYLKVTSGVCSDQPGWFSIETREQCSRVGSAHYGKDNKQASLSLNDGVPHGCYLYSSDQLWFNDGRKQETSCSSKRPCLCTNVDQGDRLLRTESCAAVGCSEASSLDECSSWGPQCCGIGTAARLSINDNVPSGCYTFSQTQLWFNDGSKAASSCTEKRPCVCDCGQMVPVQPGPASRWRFPYDNPFVLSASESVDGYPDYNPNGEQNAESCPEEWREQCTLHLHAQSSNAGELSSSLMGYTKDCKCGAPDSGHKGVAGNECYQCKAFLSTLPKPKYPNPPTTRRIIIERALGWLAHGHTYSHPSGSTVGAPEGCATEDPAQCPQYAYGTGTGSTGTTPGGAVCQDMIKMAWQISGINNNNYKINCADAEPGDAIYINSPHWLMFRRWINVQDKHEVGDDWLVYQMGGSWGKANAAIKSWTSSYVCFRHPQFLSEPFEHDMPMAVPVTV